MTGSSFGVRREVLGQRAAPERMGVCCSRREGRDPAWPRKETYRCSLATSILRRVASLYACHKRAHTSQSLRRRRLDRHCPTIRVTRGQRNCSTQLGERQPLKIV